MLDIIITVFGIAAVILLWVILYDSNRFVVQHYKVTDKRIKRNCRAVVLSDLHNKCYGKNNEKLLSAINEKKPDFVLVAGDMLTARPKSSLKPALQFMEELSKLCPVYYGNGNHEYRLKIYPETYKTMGEEYAAGLKKCGIEPLVNRHSELAEYGICVYGSEIDKFYYKRFTVKNMPSDYLPGLLGKPAESMYTLLLAHNPDYFPMYAAWGADLTLSGHVHGGIARVPVWGKGVLAPSLRIFPKYDGGVFQEGSATMILSRGLGTHTIPIRVFNPAEFWVVDFESEGQERKEENKV